MPKKFSGWLIKSSVGRTVIMPWEIEPAARIAEKNGIANAKDDEERAAIFFAAVIEHRMSKKKKGKDDD